MAISFTPGIENSNGLILDMESEHDPNVIKFDDVEHDMRRISDFKTPYTSDFNIQADELTNNVHVLTKTSLNYTIQTGTQTRIYGTSLPNEIILESGAKAELINFSGQNTILIQSNSNEFSVSRSGTVVIFEGGDGTELKIPAAMSNQTIEFSNGASMDLSILNNQVMLDDQVITTTAESIHEAIGDTTPPTLTSTTPADDSTDVAVDSDLVLIFSEDVQAGTGNFSIFKADGALFEAIPVAAATIAGDTVTLSMTEDLDPRNGYYVNVGPTVLQDLAGNNFAGITTPTTFNFTTAEPDNEGLSFDIIAETYNNDTSGFDSSYSNILLDLLTLPDAQAGMLESNQVQQAYLNIDPGEDFEFDHDTFILNDLNIGADYRIKITPADSSHFQSNKISWLYEPSGEREDLIMNLTNGFYDGSLYSDTFTAQEDGDHFLSVSMRWSAGYGEYADGPEPYDIELIEEHDEGLSFDIIEETPQREDGYVQPSYLDTSGYDTNYSNIIDDLLSFSDAQAGLLEPNEPVRAYLHWDSFEYSGFDHDTFVLDDLNAGNEYRIKITPEDPSSFQSNKISWLYEPSGEREDLIMNLTNGFYDGSLYSDTFTAQEDGDHFLSVSLGWYASDMDGQEPYDIELIEEHDDGDDYGNDDSGTTYVGSDHSTYPYSAVTYIESTFPNGETYTGSGAVVGENDVLTASHLIYSPADGGVAEDIKVYPGRDGSNIPFGSYEWDLVNYFEVDQDGDGLLDREDSEYDLAVIGFDTALGNYTGWFGLDPNAVSGDYNLTGYPGVYADWTSPRMTNDFGSVTEDSYYWVLNYNTIESNPGNSGGPLWYSENGNPYIVGVHSTGGWAVDVYSHYDEITDWIDGNDYLLDGSSEIAMATTTHEAYGDTELEVMGVNNFQNTQLGETDILV